MKQKLTKRLLYWQKLSDLLMLLHFVTRFIRTSTVHNTTQSSFTQSLSKMKDEMPPRSYYALWYAPPSGHATIKKTIIDPRIAARQTCCYILPRNVRIEYINTWYRQQGALSGSDHKENTCYRAIRNTAVEYGTCQYMSNAQGDKTIETRLWWHKQGRTNRRIDTNFTATVHAQSSQAAV